MFRVARHWATCTPAIAAAGFPWLVRKPQTSCRAQEDKVFSEDEVRRHCHERDAWISFNGAVYDITRYIPLHPPCPTLAWSKRLAGRRFEHFLGQDAYGPAHLGCGPDANCSRGVKAELAKILEPYRIGKLAPGPLSDAARRWPDVESAAVRLRLERPDGSPLGVFTIQELRKAFKPCTKTVTHKCSTSGNVNSKEWTGVRVADLLPRMGHKKPAYDTLVTFVGMDGFGYSMFWSRAMDEDVILAYEQDGEELDTEGGGPLRLVKDGQHAKWIETIIIE